MSGRRDRDRRRCVQVHDTLHVVRVLTTAVIVSHSLDAASLPGDIAFGTLHTLSRFLDQSNRAGTATLTVRSYVEESQVTQDEECAGCAEPERSTRSGIYRAGTLAA